MSEEAVTGFHTKCVHERIWAQPFLHTIDVEPTQEHYLFLRTNIYEGWYTLCQVADIRCMLPVHGGKRHMPPYLTGRRR